MREHFEKTPFAPLDQALEMLKQRFGRRCRGFQAASNPQPKIKIMQTANPMAGGCAAHTASGRAFIRLKHRINQTIFFESVAWILAWILTLLK
jgi:hypothetical protein